MATTGSPGWSVTPQPGYQINSTAVSADGGRCLLGTSEEYGTGEFAVYCYTGDGAQTWSDSLGVQAYQGVFWVALSADGGYAAAGGTISQSQDAAGFLRAYRAGDGGRLLDEKLPARVNQVALSDDGRVLVAVAGSTLRVYALEADGYHRLATHTVVGQTCLSCAVSADGTRIVVGTTREYDIARGAAGSVLCFQWRDRQLLGLCSSACEVGVLHVDMLPDGSWWAASRHDGQAMAFCDAVSLPAGTPAWTYAPAGLALSVAYGIAVARTAADEVIVACGANLASASHGCLYAVRSVPAQTGYQPSALWQQMLQYDPNPGVNMDRRGRWVTATDGQPESGGAESAGSFYLFAADSGQQAWRYATSLMNWPMAISAYGNAAFGGSDDGSGYYWTLT